MFANVDLRGHRGASMSFFNGCSFTKLRQTFRLDFVGIGFLRVLSLVLAYRLWLEP